MKDVFKVNLKTLVYDLSFLIIGYVCTVTYNKCNGLSYRDALINPILVIGGAVIVILIINIFPIKNDENRNIYENKIALIPYIIIEIFLLLICFSSNKFFGINNNTVYDFNRVYIRLIQIGVLSTLFICYFFNIKLKCFKWDISIKSFVLVIIVYILLKLSFIFKGILTGTININDIFNIKFIINVITNSIFPGIFEEVLSRGFLISGLKGIGLSEDKCNVIQAVLFGTSHVFSWGTASWIFLLSTAYQAVIGYVIGKIYLKTKSLTPCILFHGLWDAF